MTQMPPWTYSQLDSFETCPKKFYHLKVVRDITEEQGPHAEWGTRVHTAFEDFIAKGDPLPDGMTQWQPLADKLARLPGERFPEFKFSLDKNFQPADWKNSWSRGIADLLVVKGSKAVVADYKGLPLDTWLPTPTGWTTMGAVAVGDTLFSESGEQCTVIGKSEVKHLPCYRITFDDTSTVTCDEEHLWKLSGGEVVNVRALRKNDRIAVASPLALPDVELPLDPYVLGLWIADGKHSSGEISKPDAEVWAEVQRRGYDVNMATGGSKACPTRTVKGIRGTLAAIGLLGVQKKRIPGAYLRAGYQQRLDLLRGLMDGDGSVNPTRKQCVYSTTNSDLASDICELLRSLGQRPLRSEVLAHGFGKYVTAFPVSFRPIGINPFLLPRKRDRVGSWGPGLSAVRRVVSVESVPSVPTQCIKVDSPDHTFLCTVNMVPTHNTGKRKPSEQLDLYAAYTFAYQPQVEVVTTAFIWLKEKRIDKAERRREDLPDIWQKLMPRVRKLESAYERESWPERPSGLCKAYCPVTTCKFNGKGRR
jgi:hypothetical protein